MTTLHHRDDLLLRVDDVHVELGGRAVLRGIDLEVRDVHRPGLTQGQVVGILGPSGVGKTTLFRVLAGLLEPTRGRVLVTEAQRPVRPGMVGVVYQSYPLFEHRTVLGNLLAVRGSTEAAARALLERFGLADRAGAWPAELSGGQRQRVAIIQQLLCGHTYLLLDEPFSGLDPVTKACACELITELSTMDERNTIVVVTHDIRSAVQVSDTLWLLGRDHTPSGEVVPGSRVVETYDLIERDLAWHDGIEQTPRFASFVREVEARFPAL